MVFYGFWRYTQFLGDLLVGVFFVTAEAKDPLPLCGHLLYGNVDEH